MAAKTNFLTCLSFYFVFFSDINCLPEQTVWISELTKGKNLALAVNSLYNNTQVSVKLHCENNKPDTELSLTVQWVLRYTPCAEEYLRVSENLDNIANWYFDTPEHVFAFNYSYVDFIKSVPQLVKCSDVIDLEDLSGQEWERKEAKQLPVSSSQTQDSSANNRRKRDAPAEQSQSTPPAVPDAVAPQNAAVSSNGAAAAPTATNEQPQQTDTTGGHHLSEQDHAVEKYVVAKTHKDGVYLFILSVQLAQGTDAAEVDYKIEARISMKGPQGFLSAIDWPLLPFYGAMCLVYVMNGLVWLLFTMCNWRDLLRIQFWIGGVIFLGMLEKAVYFAEYESINATGRSVNGAVVFAEIVSCLKRTLARMLVIIVSLGFGIVKPRLGPMLHRVLGVGFLYFVLGTVEGLIRTLKVKTDMNRQQLFASIPLAVLDAAVCWWIFTSLVQTTRTLRLRRNLVKLSLYRHFTNTLIFAVLASVAFMIWSLKQHRLAFCLTDWKEIWVDEAFWHLLFSLILIIIMILWRPTINNQRYAFSPLLDAADDEDEDEESMMTEAFDGMKQRGGSAGQRNGSFSPKQKDEKTKVEDDLKWVEENIPSSVVDAALPALLDSDEEVVATQYERSKMQ